jgi:hypothetical protein
MADINPVVARGMTRFIGIAKDYPACPISSRSIFPVGPSVNLK